MEKGGFQLRRDLMNKLVSAALPARYHVGRRDTRQVLFEAQLGIVGKALGIGAECPQKIVDLLLNVT